MSLLTIFVMYGLTFAIKDAKLLSRPREWLASKHSFWFELLSCPYCVGFHTGWMTFLLLRAYDPSLSVVTWVTTLVSYAFAGVAVSGLLDALLIRLESPPKEDE